MTMIRWKSRNQPRDRRAGRRRCAASHASLRAAQAPETKVIRFVGVPSAGSSLVWIARDKGFDKEEGIEIQSRRRPRGRPRHRQHPGRAGRDGLRRRHHHDDALRQGRAAGQHRRTPPTRHALGADGACRTLPTGRSQDLKGKTVSVIAPNTMCVLALRARVRDRNGLAEGLRQVHGGRRRRIRWRHSAPGASTPAACSIPIALQMIEASSAAARSGASSIPSTTSRKSLGRRPDRCTAISSTKNPKTVAAIQRAIDKAAGRRQRSPGRGPDGARRRAEAGRRGMCAKISLPSYARRRRCRRGLKADRRRALYKYGFVDEADRRRRRSTAPELAPAKIALQIIHSAGQRRRRRALLYAEAAARQKAGTDYGASRAW